MCHRSAARFAFLLALLSAPATAQLRVPPLPEIALVGVIRHIEEMAVMMDDKAMQLAAGAQIRDQQNLIIVPTAIPKRGAVVVYTLDSAGQIFRVWLLTPQEVAKLKPVSGGR